MNKIKMEKHVESFKEAHNYVTAQLTAGKKVSNGIMAFFPELGKKLEGKIVDNRNIEAIGKTLPGNLRNEITEGCHVWPVYLDGTVGVCVEWPGDEARGAVSYLMASRGGRKWIKPIYGSFVGEGSARALISDKDESGVRIGFDEYGRVLPGRIVSRDGQIVSLWKTSKAGGLEIEFTPQLNIATVWAKGHKVAVGGWNNLKHQVVVATGGEPLRISAYGEIVDEYGNVFVGGRKARNILISQSESHPIGKGIKEAIGAVMATLASGFKSTEPVEEAPTEATELAYTVGADETISYLAFKKASDC